MREVIRLHKVEIENLQNVEHGTIVLSPRSSSQYEMPHANVLGIYGQNGSGKTTYVHAMKLLKQVLSGEALGMHSLPYITVDKEAAKLTVSFELALDHRSYYVDYGVSLRKNNETDIEGNKLSALEVYINEEELKVSTWQQENWSVKRTLIKQSQADEKVFSPQRLVKELADYHVDLLVAKKMARKQGTSFFFSDDALKIFAQCGNQELQDVLPALRKYGRQYLYVIDTRGWGPISMNIGLPLYFRVEDSKKKRLTAGTVFFRLDGPTILPKSSYGPLTKAIALMNPVLAELVPDMKLDLQPMGKQILPDGEKGMSFEAMSIRSNKAIPLRYESEGIKKIVAILNMFIVAYAEPSITLVVDELDAGIFEYLLGELLAIFEESGQGQLIFTSHNLRPLETLHKNSIAFTTVNPKNRYIRLKNIKANNNLRSVYYNDIQLGETDELLYEKTNNAAIRYALKKMAQQIVPAEEG